MPVKNASNELLGVIEGSDEFSFKYEVKLPEINGSGQIWLPIVKSDRFQTVEILNLNVPGEHTILEDPKNDNSILYLQ